jgi:hypothetical protein
MTPPFIELLPHDLEKDGRTFAQPYRSHSRSGKRVVKLVSPFSAIWVLPASFQARP